MPTGHRSQLEAAKAAFQLINVEGMMELENQCYILYLYKHYT